jgi:hypothetical protein
MDLEGSRPQILKLGPASKMSPRSQFLQFLRPKSTNIYEKLYNDSFWITPTSIFPITRSSGSLQWAFAISFSHCRSTFLEPLNS